MDLCLDDPNRATQLLGGFNRLLNGKGGDATGHRNAKLTQDFLALVFVNFHTSLVKLKKMHRVPKPVAKDRSAAKQQPANVSCCDSSL